MASDPLNNLDAPQQRGAARRWQTWVGAAISAFFLFLAFRGQNPQTVWETLQQVDLWWLLPAIGAFAIGVWLRALRWSVLLEPVQPLTGTEVTPVVLAGYTANNILPLRTGEIVRAYLLNGRYGVRKTAALATIAIERLLDGLTMLGFLLLAMRAVSSTPELRRVATVAAVLFAIVIVLLAVMIRGGTVRERLLDLCVRPLPARFEDSARSLFAGFLEGLATLSRRGDLAKAVVLSIAAWLCEAAVYWFVARGFGEPLSGAMTVAGAVLTTGVANLATLVPAAPGYVGTFEAGVMLAVDGALHVPREIALSYALLVHAVLWFPVTVVGAWCWWRLAAEGRSSKHVGSQATTEGRSA